MKERNRKRGFTLIELSIVLVIIGLIVGGVLVGQSLIQAAEVRAQITQIEKYNSAVNTFRGKFNALPGDMAVATAQQYGFTVGNACAGQQGGRDGNGLLDAWTPPYTLGQGKGETGLFWTDLSSSAAGNLIDGQYPNSGSSAFSCNNGIADVVSNTTVGQILPQAKIGHGNYVYVYEINGANWYGLSAVTAVSSAAYMTTGTTISVFQAYNIDKKIDDGIPQTGNVVASYISNVTQSALANAPNNATSGGDSTTCYDTTTSTYSVTINNGSGGNCALSFKFQ